MTTNHNTKGWTVGGLVGIALGFLIATAGCLLVLYVLWAFDFRGGVLLFPLLELAIGVGLTWVGIRLANCGDPRGPTR